MSQADDRQRSIDAKVERLRQRIIALSYSDAALRPVLDILKGFLDLLDDEL